MHVLNVFCHPSRNSFSGAVLDRFVEGVAASANTSETADLYRENFNPVMSERDMQLVRGEPIKDTARVLGRMVQGANLVVRLTGNDERLARPRLVSWLGLRLETRP